MKGTEKQIAWAEDIRARVVECMDWALAQVPEAQKVMYQTIKDAVATCDSAHDLIEVYGDVTRAKDNREAMMTIAVKVRDRFGFARENYTSSQLALIGR